MLSHGLAGWQGSSLIVRYHTGVPFRVTNTLWKYPNHSLKINSI